MKKVTVITGGAGGMGIGFARALAKTTDVLVADFQEERIEIAKKELADVSNIKYVLMDCSKLDEVKKLAEEAQSMGEIQNVIHAAGISEYLHDKRLTAEATIENNVCGTINVDNVFIPLLKEGCNLINIASMTSYNFPLRQHEDAFQAALKGDLEPMFKIVDGNPSQAYALSKVFIRWFTFANIERVSQRKARINSVSPGVIWTPMPQACERNKPGLILGPFKDMIPMKRVGQVEEMTSLIELLCKPGYINGTDILVDGGFTNKLGGVPQLKD